MYGAVASSAPVKAQVNFEGYNDVVDAICGLIEICILQYSYLGRFEKFKIRQTVEQQM